MTTRELDLLCFGEPLFEFNQRDDGLYETGHGGDVSNCAIAAARCGAKVGMFAHIGNDHFADSFLQLWRTEGIATEAVRRTENADTGVYFVSHDAEGHHFSYLRRNSAAAQITPADVNVDAISRARVLHVSGISQAISDSAAEAVVTAVAHARSCGTLISYDTNLRLKLWSLDKAQSVIHRVIGDCDIILPGLDDAQQLTGLHDADQIVDYYLAKGCQIVALTLGEQGVLVADGNRRERIAAFNVDAIDCNGAGDTFDGAFLANYTQHGDAFKAAHYANAAAALSTTRSGAVRSMPALAEVADFLARNST